MVKSTVSLVVRGLRRPLLVRGAAYKVTCVAKEDQKGVMIEVPGKLPENRREIQGPDLPLLLGLEIRRGH